MRKQFSLYQSHLDLAHHYWSLLISSGDVVIDATCGNGYDTRFLAELPIKRLFALDIQEQAIRSSQDALSKELSTKNFKKITWCNMCHSSFPEDIEAGSVKLVVYNLGYLPGASKSLTTEAETTINSLQAATKLIMPGGAISITCYPGHEQGVVEEASVTAFCRELNPKGWSCSRQQWINREKAPVLFFIQKSV